MGKIQNVYAKEFKEETVRLAQTSGKPIAQHALDQALARRCPTTGLLHHCDRGSQYTSRAYQACLEQSGIQSSMLCKDNCWDNAAMESFFGTLKDECVGEIIYSSHDEA